MLRGHYTAGDIKKLEVTPAKGTGLKRTCQTAVATIKDNNVIWSDGISFTVTEGGKRNNYSSLEALPKLWEKVGKIVAQKANGHGGRRPRSGRKKEERNYYDQKKPYCMRLTEREHRKLMELLHELRKEDET